ncbi:cytochrome d ubiquinol oxidase subunit II [Parvibaculum sedimenti]|uniref:Cytochrome d ubiquinol oxidase subunit II n=1 Tax=Parvibaculum sedimenti TaxID=2608632 RepID=A0A6N6VLD8_9HYPH|nr:cytochrome d ubiquinol oxidase subunit II [Parvibaculum sedimenti]KAB7739721.1 cytochrome d ubiquinol oxidase subunit II [Parvibaculum sedimenti]
MELFDYTVLRLIWWALLGILLIAFAIMDGFDFGIAMLQPYVARNDVERRVLLNVIGPVWEGNQVWFILGGGAIFAAWPMLYAVSFSGFYLAMFLILLALIVRPVAIAFRGKVDNERWRRIWDWTFVVSGFVPSLIFGVAFGNLLLGVPFHFDQTLRLTYEGNLFGLLNPFSLLCGLISLLMIAMQGGTFLALKSEEPIAGRAVKATSVAAIAYILLFTVAGVWMAYSIKGYVIEAPMISDGPSNPLLKAVSRADGAWLANYTSHPWTILAPVVAYIGALGTLIFARKRSTMLAFAVSSLTITGTICTAGFSLFPFLMPSSSNPQSSLTVWDASSSPTTLFIMLVAAVIFVPIIIAYTSWVFHVMRGPVTAEQIKTGSHNLY